MRNSWVWEVKCSTMLRLVGDDFRVYGYKRKTVSSILLTYLSPFRLVAVLDDKVVVQFRQGIK